jgi:hypothetical protein
MTYFAIRHKPTGAFMPNYGSRKGRGGFTHDEPSALAPPRLFPRRHHAQTALAHWLRGKLTVSNYRDDYTGEWDEDWSCKKVPERKAEDMEIVEVTIVVTP